MRAAGHAQDVGAVPRGPVGERGQIVARTQRDRPDAPLGGRGSQIHPGGRAVTGSRIDQQHAGPSRSAGAGRYAGGQQRAGR
ncbi:MAG TPA: hypothetical protein VFH03_10805, partial [Actinoplanes sp.]|nr:hypothetical protein [Actinoplanes sp.]